MTERTAAAVAALALIVAAPALGQPAPPATRPAPATRPVAASPIVGAMLSRDADPLAASPGPAVDPADAAAEQQRQQAEQQRVQALVQATYDRRPAAALGALAADPSAAAPPGPAGEVAATKADVAAGRWAAVGERLASLPADGARQVHRRIAESLASPQLDPNGNDPNPAPPPAMTPLDVLDLADALPEGATPDAAGVAALGRLLARTVGAGAPAEPAVGRLAEGTRHFGPASPDAAGFSPESRRRAADLLAAAGLLADAGPFLPSDADALASADATALDLQARYRLELSGRPVRAAESAGVTPVPATPDDVPADLRRSLARQNLRAAWDLTQAVLALPDEPPATRPSDAPGDAEASPPTPGEVPHHEAQHGAPDAGGPVVVMTPNGPMVLPGPGGPGGPDVPGGAPVPDGPGKVAALKAEAIRRSLVIAPQLGGDARADWLAAAFGPSAERRRGLAVVAATASLAPPSMQARPWEPRNEGLVRQREVVAGLVAAAGGELPEPKAVADPTGGGASKTYDAADPSTRPATRPIGGDGADPAVVAALDPWSAVLDLTAVNWLTEADFTLSRPDDRGAMADDGYLYNSMGNLVRINSPQQQFDDGRTAKPIPAADLLASMPAGAWAEALGPALRPRLLKAEADVRLRADQIAAAVPAIAVVAEDRPERSRELSDELLRVWGRVRNPNKEQSRFGQQMFSPYGMQRDQGIPLTRSAQGRNLDELRSLLGTLRSLPGGGPSPGAVVSAFDAAHSAAEVYDPADVAAVFGPPEAMPADTLAPLAGTMRSALASRWRESKAQEDAKTRRTDAQLDAEVARGYAMVESMLDVRTATLSSDPTTRPATADADSDESPDAQLADVLAALGAARFEWAEFDFGRQVPLAEYTAKRNEAFDAYGAAADAHARAVATRQADPDAVDADGDADASVYRAWFDAALGASDLSELTRQAEPEPTQLAAIRDALLALPGGAADAHLTAFADGLEAASSSLKPELKPRYLRAALEIIGDHPGAASARASVRYYDDLLREVELRADVDGPPTVGHGEPFGLVLSLRHTEALGREAGGFGKYLQNQKAQQQYAYTPPGGRGPVDYRDDFEKRVRTALGESFEVRSITWADEKSVEPRASDRGGWRETPLAYAVLAATDAAVDKVPPVQIDLDFSDKKGAVILPVSSGVTLIDARPDDPPARPVSDLEVVMTLDDRGVSGGSGVAAGGPEPGTVVLDVRATGRGLVPELEDLLAIEGPSAVPGFAVEDTADQGLSVASLDTASPDLAAVSERSWLVTLRSTGGATAEGEVPTDASAGAFRFPAVAVDPAAVKSVTYRRYDDADVVDVGREVALAGVGAGASAYAWVAWLAAGVAAIAAIAWGAARSLRPRGRTPDAGRHAVPERLTPVTALSLLRRIEADARPESRPELADAIRSVEQRYFAPPTPGDDGGGGGDDADLRRLVSRYAT